MVERMKKRVVRRRGNGEWIVDLVDGMMNLEVLSRGLVYGGRWIG
jgi:hypothetical protein